MRRIAFDGKFLLADADGSGFEIFFDDGFGFGQVGRFVGEEDELVRMTLGEREYGFIASAIRVESELRAGGQQDGFGYAEIRLMRDEIVVVAVPIVGVLMNVYDARRRRVADCVRARS